MNEKQYQIFDTEIGPCGIAWTPALAVSEFQLPEETPAATEERIRRRSKGERCLTPPSPIVELIERVQRHLRGDWHDFTDVAVDVSGMGEFERSVYEATRRIANGRVRTYGEIAKEIGKPGAARAVGQALGRNPIALIIPCHRVLAAGQESGGFSAYGGRSTKSKLLSIERAILTLDL